LWERPERAAETARRDDLASNVVRTSMTQTPNSKPLIVAEDPAAASVAERQP